MLKHTIRRLLQAIPTFFGITILSYAIMVAAPGSPTDFLAANPQTTRAQREALAAQLGADDPLYEQYVRWLIGNDWREFPQVDRRGRPLKDDAGNPVMVHGTHKGILRGDFGDSFTSNRDALEVIKEKIPATLELGGLALLVGFAFGIPVGILAAVWQGSAFDNITRVIAVVFSAVPIFWLGLVLILIFGSQLALLPMGGRYPVDYVVRGEVTFQERIEHLILPVFVLSTGYIAIFSRFMRAATLDVLGQDYIRTARAKGLKDVRVWFGHAARNALIPIATILGPAIPNIISGALITETIFSWPGLGRTAFTAVVGQDYPVVMGTVIIGAIATILGYILSDMLYALADPRVRLA